MIQPSVSIYTYPVYPDVQFTPPVIRAVATGGISVYIYPPKIRPGKFLWSKNDDLMVIDLIMYIIRPIPPQKVQQ